MQILRPGDSEYENAATTFMGQKGSPRIIYQPATTKEVCQAVSECVKENDAISIKSGGHSNSGFSTNDGGSIIDLQDLNTIDIIDKDRGIVRIGAGAVWGTVAEKLSEYGLAISSGDTKSVGVGGLTTGGGIGWMVREYGLTIDNLESAEIVTADGQSRSTDTTHDPDLFWAIKGGGGNFGIVTYFTFRAHRVDDVYTGTLVYDTDNVSYLLSRWNEYMQIADTRLTTSATILPAFGGSKPMVLINCCFASDDESEAMTVFKPLKHLGNLKKDDIARKKYYEILEDANPPQGMRIIVNNAFFNLNTETIAAIEKAMQINNDVILQIRSLGGAMANIGDEETAFAHRSFDVLIVCPTFIANDATKEDTFKSLTAWRVVAPHGVGHYGNLLSPIGDAITRGMYPPATYARLAKIKKHYDPQNIFRQCHNIMP